MKVNFTYVHIFLGVAMLVVLGFLFNTIRTHNPEQENWLKEKVHEVTLTNQALNQNLLRYQFGISSNFNDISANSEQLKQLNSALAEGDHAVKRLGIPELTKFVDELSLKLISKEQQINNFYLDNTTLRKSVDFTRRQIRDIAGNSAILKQLDQSLNTAVTNKITPSTSNLQSLNNELKQSIAQFPPSQQFTVQEITNQTDAIIEKNNNIFKILESSTDNNQNTLTQNFEAALDDYFKKRQQTTFYIQSFLFIISILVSIWAIYLLFKLGGQQSALKTAEANIGNLKFAFDQHAIISFSDAAGNFTHVNEKFCALSEYSADELIGKNHWTMHSGENSDDIYSDIIEKTNNGEVWHGELHSKTNTGKSYWVYASIVPFLDNAGKVYQLISIRTDITLSKNLEKQILESRNFIQKLTDTITQGVYSVDKQGLCSFWNKQAEHILGWSKREVIMRDLLNFVVFIDPQNKVIDMRQYLLQDQTFTIEARVRCKNGVTLPVSITTAPLQENNRVIGSVVVFQDISDLKEQQRLLNEAMQAAEQANQTKSAFLANMSHEIRTPMNGIIGMTDLALETELTPEQREFLNISKSSANALLTIINDILDFSKIEAGKLELDNIEFDVQQSLRQTIKNLAIRAYQKGLETILDIDTAVPRRLIGDPGRLGQIIINLMGNAIKFTEHGEIIIRVRFLSQKDNHTCLQFFVEDSGIGIPDDRQKDVFNSFSQVDASVFRKYGGTGLGLSIAKQLVELMHGKIGLKSQLGKGTTFYFTVWLQNSSTEVAKITPLKLLNAMPVLLVDDNQRMQNLISESLNRWGMEVIAFSQANEALSYLQHLSAQVKPPQLLLIDEELPDLDGFSLIEQIQRQNLSEAPAIMLLSSIYSASKARNRAAKIACIISKPASQSDLLDAIHTVFEGPVAQPLSTDESSQHFKIIKPLDILLAEDNEINQKLAIRLLEKQNHKITIANNGVECLEKLAQHDFDLVLMDFQMPVMDGLTATRKIREQGNTVPVIAMTANAMKGDRERALESGMNDYLSKPIKAQELFEVIGRYFPEIDKTEIESKSADSSDNQQSNPTKASQSSVEPTPNMSITDINRAGQVSAAADALPISNWHAALELLGGDREILVNMAEMYITNAESYATNIIEALEKQDAEVLTRALHTLKGIFALFQASIPEQILIKAEHDAQNKQFAEISAVLEDIKRYTVMLKEFLVQKLSA